MKRFCAVLFLLLVAVSPAARAEGPDDQYIGIYSLIKQGDLYVERGQNSLALAKYVDAHTALKKFQVNYADWNVKVVKYRLAYLAGKMDELSGKTPPVKTPAVPIPATATNPPAITNTPVTPVVISTPPATNVIAPTPKSIYTPGPLPADAADRIAALQDQVAHLEADKTMLESKLKEALAAQPAASDPRELAKAQERIKSLEKENDLLKFSLAQARTNSVQANMALLEQTRKELAEANRKVNELTDANATLMTERTALQARIKAQSSAVPDSAAAALREENDILKKQLADMKTKATAAAPSDELARKLVEAQTQLAAMQSDKEILRIEKAALEDRIRELSTKNNGGKAAVVSSPLADSAASGKIKELELQRDELQKSLDAATKEIYGKKKGKETATRIDEMTKQLTGLRARIDTLEAKQVPYMPEELALLNKPDASMIAAAHSGKKTVKELPPKATALLAEARRHLSEHHLDLAEKTYLELLKLDEKNMSTLDDLASIEIEMNRPAEAEKYLQASMSVDPNNDYTLYVIGRLRFLQEKFDDSLNALSRAGQINPQDPEIQNLLGVVLSEKGLRGPAEAALRRAIQIDPNYADAHANLAFVYVMQQPPLTELARWHYQKSITAGHVHDPRLEKLLYPDGGISAR